MLIIGPQPPSDAPKSSSGGRLAGRKKLHLLSSSLFRFQPHGEDTRSSTRCRKAGQPQVWSRDRSFRERERSMILSLRSQRAVETMAAPELGAM
ncbi:hypothetical protein THAOC_35588 [Thalassiosira oceanica]|uniref:Uncharacterized protein n=1 Tax=Thalassiosira oceanica TaxID=159749 RepID=K0R1H9_THAOC|nr:hypothetical protein THAOC_35588 [Thalassiosira oceanica]|eukprot:EJK45780.1 hypothetical protein THAOC_35588 [Thalassiosira oceanica]